MSYPTLTRDSANRVLSVFKAEGDVEAALLEESMWTELGDFDAVVAVDLSNSLWELVGTVPNGGAKFDRLASPTVHQHLSLDTVVAGDPGFWRWLTFSADGRFADLINWRYGPSSGDHARSDYFGLDQAKKGMLNYLWLCADAVYDDGQDDPYELVHRGDVDTWQSHIVRVDFGSVRQMARAFIKYVFPNNESNRLTREEYRILAKEITRRNASISFELFSERDCTQFIDDIWNDREAWRGNVKSN